MKSMYVVDIKTSSRVQEESENQDKLNALRTGKFYVKQNKRNNGTKGKDKR